MIVSFSDTLRFLRERKKISQRKLSAKLGLSETMVAQYEAGNRMPSFISLVRIAKYFGVSTDYLLGLEKDDRISFDVSDLTLQQQQTIQSIIEQFRQANH